MAFGLSTPLVARAGRDLGPFTTAALLYAGAALAGLACGRLPSLRGRGHRLGRRDVPRVLLVAVLGAVLAPSLLAFGLQRTSPSGASLVLNLEAVFTMALAAWLFGEPIGRRALVAAALMLLGGGLLLLGGSAGDAGASSLVGIMAVVGATLAWAGDNAGSRGLSEAEPLAVVAWKGGIGAGLSLVVALVRGEAIPAGSALPIALLLGLGFAGYGLSLALYLVAQRSLGAGRTASVFALGPFLGAGLAMLLGDRQASLFTLAAAAAFGLGVVIHLREPHGHPHVHEPLEHDHFHRHDDGHHDGHAHGPDAPPLDARGRGHSHRHAHARVEHEHPHAPDLHHRHGH